MCCREYSGACTFVGMPAWYTCNDSNCKTPQCMCASNSAPNGLKPEETPQFILITHDDAVNAFSNKVVRQVIDKHTNPNGCNVPATWYTLQQGSDCNIIKNLWEQNNEIATHTVNHKALVENFKGGLPALRQEMFGVRDWLTENCGIPKEEIVGFRSPYLVHNAATREEIRKEGMLYDASMISAFNIDSEVETVPGERVWPFTMDQGIPINCNWNFPYGRCDGATERYSGIWEVPLWELQNAAGEHLFSMDPEGDVFSILKENFDMNYQNNRAPFGIFLHAPWFTDEHTEALNNFMEWAMSQKDVWAITTRQLIQWMQDPVPASGMGEWLKCKDVDLSAPLGDVRCQLYTIKADDTAYTVATSFAVMTDEFLQVNPEIGDGSVLRVGDTVRIPPWDDGCVGNAIFNVTGPGQVTSGMENGGDGFPGEGGLCKTHTVAVSDTWESIGIEYQTSIEELKKANPDLGDDNLSPGNRVRIPPYGDTCPVFINKPKPGLGDEASDVQDTDAPISGLRINLVLQGRPKIDFQTDLEEPFKATVARALDIKTGEVRVVSVEALNVAAGLRKLQEVPEVGIELTIATPVPLTIYRNITEALSPDSSFAKEQLAAFDLSLSEEPTIRAIENYKTYDIEESSNPGVSIDEDGNLVPSSGGDNGAAGDSSSGSSGLSVGAIVGIAVGGAIGLLTVALIGFFVLRRNKKECLDESSDASGESQLKPPSDQGVGPMMYPLSNDSMKSSEDGDKQPLYSI